MKVCAGCGAAKPLDAYGLVKGEPKPLCKPCHKARYYKYVKKLSQVPSGPKKCQDCAEIKPLTEFPRQSASRDGRFSYCKPCAASRTRKGRDANPEKAAERYKRWAQDNRERRAESHRAWAAANPEKVAERVKRWIAANPDKRARIDANARAKRLQRFVPWADQSAIQTIYTDARRISQETGLSHHVDHIIPLNGRKVSGLHVPENLQVLPANDNRRKSNKFAVE